ncbi:MAG: hypothetical protein II879_13020 [Clostridia bacterium]|nr:hypothetical protein [Clostridia bacterium]
MEDCVTQIVPVVAPKNHKTDIQNGGANVKKGMSRASIEEKLRIAKMESETAGFIHSRDLHRHIQRLEKLLKKLNSEQTMQAEKKK